MHAQRRTTKQGVPDLNGPRMNGAGYNGNRSASCSHHRAPDLVAKTKRSKLVERDGVIVTAYFEYCLECGVELHEVE